ncbi:hypothetical protein LCGC14_0372700 [marine sediment metagenome]|uniref:Uncharacterized protein n=1 Tax=marine sediment metagenome TaxID=412755 RepID=A0A0F9TAM5_9ZZZZ
MADSTTFPFAIFRFTGAGDTELSIGNNEAVGMDIGLDDNSNKKIGLLSYRPVFDSRRTDVPNPDQESTTVPDTGLIPTGFELDIIVNEKVDDNIDLAKLSKFSLQPKAIRDFYSEGRFGIRYDAKSYLNVTPTNVLGLKLIHYDFIDDFVWGGLDHVKLTFALGGVPAAIITAIDVFLPP